MYFKCRYCHKDIVGSDNRAHIYYRGDDSDDPEPYYFVHVACSKAHIASISGSSSSHEHDSGEIACTFCKKGVTGEALIRYKYEDHYVDETLVFHRTCEKPYRLFQAGKVHQCPKCEGLGFIMVNNSTCKLCEGDGMLEKPAIPIDWKKAP